MNSPTKQTFADLSEVEESVLADTLLRTFRMLYRLENGAMGDNPPRSWSLRKRLRSELLFELAALTHQELKSKG